MATGDMPHISAASHTHTAYGLANLGSALNIYEGTAAANPFVVGNPRAALGEGIPQQQNFLVKTTPVVKPKKEEKTMTQARRLVQVFIADPDENVPLESSLLYSGDQKVTDLTDQELFFEIDIKSMLDAHNAKRVKIINRKVKERVEHLEPTKIRDLRMVVVVVASF